MEKILIVDCDKETRFALSELLGSQGYRIIIANDGKSAILEAGKSSPDLVLLDVMLPEMDGLKVIEEMRRLKKDLLVIVLTACDDLKKAIRAMKLGAFDYIKKPFNNDELVYQIKMAFAARLIKDTNDSKKNGAGFSCDDVVGASPSMRRVFEQIERIAPTNMTVVLQGESGTGKELIPRAIHLKSPRREKPFVVIDCGTLPENLVESELFGYEKGAFTGADERKEGQFELANGGTLFLDEITNISLNVQMKLLRVIQERKMRHLGGKRDIDVDVRIITATNTDFAGQVELGKFRSDLYYRLSEFFIELPPLRERKEDIPLLARHFMEKVKAEIGKDVKGISEEAMKVLMDYDWPGNVREFRNVIRRGALLADSDCVTLKDLPREFLFKTHEAFTGSVIDRGISLHELTKGLTTNMEREIILEALALSKNNKSKAAKLLKIDRVTLYSKLKSLEIK